nr:hypothetical protein [Tanacetum cinerariifolium]
MNNMSQKKKDDSNEMVIKEIRVLEVGDNDKHVELNEVIVNGVFGNNVNEISTNYDQNASNHESNFKNFVDSMHDASVDYDTYNDKVNKCNIDDSDKGTNVNNT